MNSKCLTLSYPVCCGPCSHCPCIPHSPSSLPCSRRAGNILLPSWAPSLLQGCPASSLSLPRVWPTPASSYSASGSDVCHLLRNIFHGWSSTTIPSHSWLPSSHFSDLFFSVLITIWKNFVYMFIHCLFQLEWKFLEGGSHISLVHCCIVTPRSMFSQYLSR